MKFLSFAATALMSALPFVSSAQNNPSTPNGTPAPTAPAQTPHNSSASAPAIAPDPEVLFLVGLPLKDTPENIVTYSRRMYVRSAEIQDSVLRQLIRLTLVRLEETPGDAEKIQRDHMARMSDFFYSSAKTAEEAGDIKAASTAIQIAVRCNPANAKAKLLWANLPHVHGKSTAEAIQTLQHGLAFLSITDPDSGAYLDRYFRLLESIQRDREVADEATKLLRSGDAIPTSTREILVLHAATALDWIGDYASAVEILQRNKLTKYVQARLLEARAYFYGGKTQNGIQVLNEAIVDFKGAERDAILSQLGRFYTDLGRMDLALAVAEQRITETPANAQPRIHRLYILEKLNRPDAYKKELEEILNKFSQNQGALMALANYAADRGHPSIADTCYAIADRQNFNRQVFATLVIEAYIRARKPDVAIKYYQALLKGDPRFFRESYASVCALVGAASIATGDVATGRRYLEEFLTDKQIDPQTLNEISSKPRDIPVILYISVGQLLRSIGAPEDALKILETGTRAYPYDSQLKADYISARIVCNATEKYGYRKALTEEVDELIKMRRPTAFVWRDILLWLKTDSTIPADKAIQYRALAAPLSRPDLVGLENRAAQ